MSVVIMVFAVVFVAAYLLVVRSFFNTESGGLMEKFVFVDIVLLVGLVMFRRGVKRLRKLSDTLAQKMATRPGAAPTAISKSTPVASPMQNGRSRSSSRTPGLPGWKNARQARRHGSPAWRDCCESHRRCSSNRRCRHGYSRDGWSGRGLLRG